MRARPETVRFPGGRRARLLGVAADADPRQVLRQLAFPRPKSLILLSGGAGGLAQSLQARLAELFGGVARAAAECGAAFVDGGTDAGVMALLGRAVAACGHRSPILGVAPAHKVVYPGRAPAQGAEQDSAALEPNHSHFVLVDTPEWGGETDLMYALAAVLAQGVPALLLLANGGAICRREVLRGARLGAGLLVLEGSGRLADQLAALHRAPPPRTDDPPLAEILACPRLDLFPLSGPVSELERLVRRLL